MPFEQPWRNSLHRVCLRAHCLAKIHTADKTRASARTLESFLHILLKTSQNPSNYIAFTNTAPTLSTNSYSAKKRKVKIKSWASQSWDLRQTDHAHPVHVKKKSKQHSQVNAPRTWQRKKKHMPHALDSSNMVCLCRRSALHLFFSAGKQNIGEPCNSGNITNIQPVFDSD